MHFMANRGDDDFKADVKKAVDAGSDLSQGGEHAYKNLMAELAKDQAKYGNNPARFDKLGQEVAQGLQANNVIDTHMLRWSRDNMDRFATADQSEVKKIELDPAAPGNAGRVNGFERAMMTRFQDTYGDLQKEAPKTFWGNDKDAFSHKDFDKLIAGREQPLVEARARSEQSDLAQRKEAQKAEVTASLLANTGDPKTSLAAALDNIRGGKPDGEISHRDVRQFLDNYAAGHARGDSVYNERNLKAAQLLDAQWDDALGKSLRGTYQDNSRDNHETRTHDHINLDRLAQMNNYQSADAMMAAYSTNGQPGAGRIRPVSAVDSQPVVPQVAPDGNTALQGDPRPLRQDASVLRSGDGQPVLDGSGNPVRTGSDDVAARPVRAPQGDVSADGSDTRPVRPARHGAPRNEHEALFSGKMGDHQAPATRGIRPPADAQVAQEGQPRPVRPRPGDQGAQDTAPPKRAAAPSDNGRDPNDVPPLVAPDIKIDGDIAQQRADFSKQVSDYLQAKASYTPTPGQGWDRIARDVMRRAGNNDFRDEVKVETLSDQIAKLNGTQGRNDMDGRPRLGVPVRIMSDDDVKAASDALLKRFDAQVEALKGAKAPDAAKDDPNIFDPKRSEIPATDAAKPATDAAKPATDAAKPATDAAKPATDAAKPATDAAKPATADARTPDQAIPPKPAAPAYVDHSQDPPAKPAAAADDKSRVQADLKAGKKVGLADIGSPASDDPASLSPASAKQAEDARKRAEAAKAKPAAGSADLNLGLNTDTWSVDG
jgi:hypothetical protein